MDGRIRQKHDRFARMLSTRETIGLRGKSALKARGYSDDEIEATRKSLISKSKRAGVRLAVNKHY